MSGQGSDGDPVHRISSRIPITAGTSRERVWAALTDLASMPGLHPQVLGAHWLDGARQSAPGARFATENADPEHGVWLAVSRIVAFHPPTTIAWTIESDLAPAAVCRFDVVDEAGTVSLQQTYVVDTRPGARPPVAEALVVTARGRGPAGPAG